MISEIREGDEYERVSGINGLLVRRIISVQSERVIYWLSERNGSGGETTSRSPGLVKQWIDNGYWKPRWDPRLAVPEGL